MSRYKVKNGGTPEVHTARSKLNGVLQNLRERTDDSPAEDSFIKEEPDDSDEFGSPSKSGRQTSHRQSGIPRKRKRVREETPPLDSGLLFHHTYVLKLFDRSVDLAQFEESSSLYPVCRAWIKNQPHNRDLGIRERTPTPEPEVFGLPEDAELIRRDYTANGGWETFLSYEDPEQDILIGLLRLRKCSEDTYRPELKGGCSIVRELHVYGTAVPVHARDPTKFQHQGFGMLLMEEAERIASEEHGSHKIAVISGVGTRNYYRKIGYELEGPYMVKSL